MAMFPIGTILNLAQSTFNLTTKQKDPKGRLRKRFDRMAKEEEIDFEEIDSLWELVNQESEERLSAYTNHFLNDQSWYLYRTAYTVLTTHLSVIGIPDRILHYILWREIGNWVVIQLCRWIAHAQEEELPMAYHSDPLWFFPRYQQEQASPYAYLFAGVIYGLNLTDESNRMLVNLFVHPEDDAIRYEQKSKDREREMQSWLSGASIPRWSTLEDCRDALQVNMGNIPDGQLRRSRAHILRDFTENAVVLCFSCDFAERMIKIAGQSGYSMWLHKMAENIVQHFSEDPHGALQNFMIPSPRLSIKEMLSGYIQYLEEQAEILSNDVDEPVDSGTVTALHNTCATALKSPTLTEELWSSLYCARYQEGPIFTELLLKAYSLALEQGDKVALYELHRLGYYHGLFKSTSVAARSWVRDQLEERFPFFILTQNDIKRIRRWAPRSVNSFREVGNYKRTPLMIHAWLGDRIEVEKILHAGADPDLLSEAKKHRNGDNSSALLLAIQGYQQYVWQEEHPKYAAYRAIISLILQALPKDAKSLGASTLIRNTTPLYAAIESCDLNVVEELLTKGAAPNQAAGGDCFSPLYGTMNLFAFYRRFREWDTDTFLEWLCLPHRIDPHRMRLPLQPGIVTSKNFYQHRRMLLHDPNFQRIYRKAVVHTFRHPITAEANLLAIIDLLAEYGADPNSLQPNGYTPCDLALEIGNEELIGLIQKIGGTKTLIL